MQNLVIGFRDIAYPWGKAILIIISSGDYFGSAYWIASCLTIEGPHYRRANNVGPTCNVPYIARFQQIFSCSEQLFLLNTSHEQNKFEIYLPVSLLSQRSSSIGPTSQFVRTCWKDLGLLERKRSLRLPSFIPGERYKINCSVGERNLVIHQEVM